MLANASDKSALGINSLIVDMKDFSNLKFIKRISDETELSVVSEYCSGEPSHVIKAMRLESMINIALIISL